MDEKTGELPRRTYRCYQCTYKTDRKNNLKRHVTTMHESCDKTLECCGQTFANKAELRCHVIRCHRHGYVCRECGRNFCRKALLKRHVTVHSGQKDYSCDVCGYATSHKSNLDRHKRRHLPKHQQQQLQMMTALCANLTAVRRKHASAKIRPRHGLNVTRTTDGNREFRTDAVHRGHAESTDVISSLPTQKLAYDEEMKRKVVDADFAEFESSTESSLQLKDKRLFAYNYVCPVRGCRASFRRQLHSVYHHVFCHPDEIRDSSVHFLPPITVQINAWYAHIQKATLHAH